MFLCQLSVLSGFLILWVEGGGGGVGPQSFIRPSLDPNFERVEDVPLLPKVVRDSDDNKLLADDTVDVVPDRHSLLDFTYGGDEDYRGSAAVSDSNPVVIFPELGGGNNKKNPAEDEKPIGNCPNSRPQQSPPPTPAVDENTRERIKAQDRDLLIQAHKNAIFGYHAMTSSPPAAIHEPMNSVKMLELTGEVFKKFCPVSVIPSSFTDHVITLFTLLHNHVTPNREPYLTDEETTWISKLLGQCRDNRTTIRGDFTIDPKCRMRIVADGNRQPICPEPMERPNPTHYDPLLDIVWRIFEVVHSACFDHFQGYARIWHRYVMGIDDLFNLPLRQRWTAVVSQEIHFIRLLGPTYDIYAENIDQCVQYWALKSPVKVRLPRLSQPFLVRYGANVPNIFS